MPTYPLTVLPAIKSRDRGTLDVVEVNEDDDDTFAIDLPPGTLSRYSVLPEIGEVEAIGLYTIVGVTAGT
ncbi:hypothetical protein [Burkholderia ubonensis]|uniref:hypothetical protein n=1 Tax=Burkholderia ubonensis TaxID=101571 RepID=UPI00075875DA|nr:hypothetical protein [Burkholderia ubonensis]KVN37553.1 hypothetical protein WJ64_05285 [Burkholderia ubonensis]